jgi:Rieske Fe-S protein
MIPAWPHDLESNVTRSRARLNRLAVVRVDPETLDEKTRPNAAEGVLAFSSFCTHQGCTVGGWMPEGSLLACACHGSTFDVTRSGAVMGGPAKRRLAMLPLALEDGALVVAGAFTSKLGYT